MVIGVALGTAHVKEKHARPGFLSNFILGSQDGLVNVLGIILGVSAVTSNVQLILVAGLAALGAESISMGAVAYTSTLARRKLYIKEEEREISEMKNIPKMERKEVRNVLAGWGYRGKKLDSLCDDICSNRKAWLEFMMAFELRLQPTAKTEPMNSFTLVFLATIIGSVIPLLPFFFYPNIGADQIIAIVISAITLFVVGFYEAKTTVGSLWRSGLQMLVIGMVAGFAGFLIGKLVGAAPI